MPSKSAKQHRLMEAVAHNKAFAKKVGIPQSVGKDFSAADKGKKLKKGGDVWDKPNPVKKHKTLTPAKKTAAKEMAKKAGRPYPNLVDNMRAARKK